VNDFLGIERAKRNLWPSTATEHDVLKTIRDCSNGFLVVAFLQAAGGYLLSDGHGWLWVDGIAYAVLGLLLRISKSRVIALAMSVLSSVATVSTFLNLVGAGPGGGNNLVLATILLWTSILAIRATFALHKMRGLPPSSGGTVPAETTRASE